MDRLQCLKVFCEVARSRSFVRAARKLSLSRSSVTKYVAELESMMGARLLNRTTKQVAVTEAGQRVVDAAGEVLNRYELMESEVRDSVHLPRGAIRVGTPPSFGTHHLMQVIARFADRFPDIEVSVVLDDGSADLVAEALDLTIRIAPVFDDASHIALPLLKARRVLVAAPAYLKRRGRPRTIMELTRHNCLIHSRQSPSAIWTFSGPPVTDVRVHGSIRSNLGDALKQAALLGSGIAMQPYYMVSRELEMGLLEIVLADSAPLELDINVVYSARRNLPLRVRYLLDFLEEWARTPPAWAVMENRVGRASRK